jgi:uncharacterized damage-inducible protein DinB
MTRAEILLVEFTHEAATTRKHLERLPPEQFAWRPHHKSYTAGDLASHIVDCVTWVRRIFLAEEFDFNPRIYERFDAASVQALLDAFDTHVSEAHQALASTSDTNADRPWRLTINGKPWFEKPREAVFRDMTLSHLIHHRGQLSVYLRLLDVPVPGSYGPTADE